LQVRARAALELRRRGQTFSEDKSELTRYDPIRYVSERFGWAPWRGTPDAPGQAEVFDAYVLALRQQHEREAFEAGEVTEAELQYWRPGQVIKNRIRVEAGHTVGKTKAAAGLISHFFDHFAPSIVYTFAPSWEQVKDLLWKEIGTDRADKALPGRVLDNCELKYKKDHFAKGRATNNTHGRGTERVQGQHGKYLMFVPDEAEGVADYVYDAIDSMTSGGITIVLMLANPRTRTSKFHKAGSFSNVKNIRISCLNHPNVVHGREIVPGGVKRQYVEEMLEKHCEIVREHNADEHTFTIPFSVQVNGITYPAGTIFKPDPEFMFRVLGIAPASVSDKNLIPVGRFEAATKRTPQPDRPQCMRIGVDVARFGRDFGTIYIRYNGAVWCAGRPSRVDTTEYVQSIKAAALSVKRQHPNITSLHVRIDGGGGFGRGVADRLKIDDEMIRAFPDFVVLEVHFNATPRDEAAFYDGITEWTADVAESLKILAIINPPEALQADLCEREYGWRNAKGKEVKKLESKEEVRRRLNPPRSPDDGDGFVLAAVSDHLLALPDISVISFGKARGW